MRQASTRRGRWGAAPLWIGRALQTVALVQLLVELPGVFFPEEFYTVAFVAAPLGLSQQSLVFNAVLLFVVGVAVRRRKHAALVFLVLFEAATVAAVVLDIVIGPKPDEFLVWDVLAGVIALGVIALLILCRREFTARRAPAAYTTAVIVLAIGVATAVVVGGILSGRVTGTLASRTDGWWWSVSAAVGLDPNGYLLDDVAGRPDPAISLLVSSISSVFLLLAVLIVIRTSTLRRTIGPDEELAIRRILLGSRTEDSLGYFATRRDKAVVFSENGRAAVSFAVVGGVALASGDPLGEEADAAGAIDAWLAVVRRYGWKPAVVAASERGARQYQRAGLRSTVMGEEAVVPTSGRPMPRALVLAARRVGAAGYRARVRLQSELADDELEELRRAAEEWRGSDVERGFSMALGRVGDPVDGGTLVVTAHDEHDRLAALQVFVPWNRDGLSLDVSRRRPDAANGVIEFLVAQLVGEAAQRGIRRLSMNFAMFRDVVVGADRPGAGMLLRLRGTVVVFLSRWWQLESLRRQNEKYEPDWRPRLICWDRGASLAHVALVAARAEGFLWSGRSRSPHARHTAWPADFAEVVAGLVPPPVTTARRRSRTFDARAGAADDWRREGIDPYPVAVARTGSIRGVRDAFGADGVPESAAAMSIAGRVTGRRDHGGIVFFDVVEDGASIQILADRSSTEAFTALRRLGRGDLVSVTGRPIRTKTGELTIAAVRWAPAAKALHAPPDRGGLRDPAKRIRQRHVELATNPEAARMVRDRSAAVGALRAHLTAADYLEVETPILQAVHGGASARPFRTHLHAYHRDLTLRVAPELALKKLVVSGFGRVFEIGRNFRNEGVDATHNPEFTAVEVYAAYADYTDMRTLARDVVLAMATAVHGEPVAPHGDGVIDLSAEWPVIPVHEAVSRALGTAVTPSTDVGDLRALARTAGIRVASSATAGEIVEELYGELVERTTVGPTFYTDFPTDTSLLARPHRHDPRLAERWDLVAFGTELGTAYSELTDPIEQRRRLTSQSLRAAGGDPEAMEVDEDFLSALEFGMPPTGGLGLGVDRIVMLLTGRSIRETLAFPFVAPHRS